MASSHIMGAMTHSRTLCFFPRGELGWHSMIPKAGVTVEEVNDAREIRRQRGQGNGDDDLGNLF